jgi:hypothetical protein
VLQNSTPLVTIVDVFHLFLVERRLWVDFAPAGSFSFKALESTIQPVDEVFGPLLLDEDAVCATTLIIKIARLIRISEVAFTDDHESLESLQLNTSGHPILIYRST